MLNIHRQKRRCKAKAIKRLHGCNMVSGQVSVCGVEICRAVSEKYA